MVELNKTQEVTLEKTLENVHEICKTLSMDESALRRKVIEIYNETHPNSEVDLNEYV